MKLPRVDHTPKALPREFPGAIWYQDEEVKAAERVLRAQSPFRYYGPAPELGHNIEKETELEALAQRP